MLILRIRNSGSLITEVHLQDGRDYICGKAEGCDILLPDDKQISKQHFKLTQVDGSWKVEVLSRFASVLFHGERETDFALKPGDGFIAAPFDFELVQVEERAQAPAQQESHGENFPVPYEGHVDGHLPVVFEGDNEATFIGNLNFMPYIKMIDQFNEAKAVYRLEGDAWVAGRDPANPIHINDARVSRRQFEVRKGANGFFIIDLGSVNGTLLNGDLISSTEPTPLKSGDAISVLDNHMYFELRDPSYNEKVKVINAVPVHAVTPVHNQMQNAGVLQPLPGPVFAQTQDYPVHYPQHHGGHTNTYHPPMPQKRGFDWKKNKVRVAIVVVLIFGLYFGLEEQEAPMADKKDKPVAQNPAEAEFAKLPPEQQAFVKQAFELATGLFQQQKFELARNEIIKIKSYVNEYKNSKELEALASKAIDDLAEIRRLEERKQAEEEQRIKIERQAEICKKIINPKIEMAQLDECFAPVIEFNPDAAPIVALRNEVEAIINERTAKEMLDKENADKAAKLRAIFNAAEKTAKSSGPQTAIKAYEGVIKSDLPDPSGLKATSKRRIASILDGISRKVAGFTGKGDKALGESKYREAVISFRGALEIDPFNLEVKAKYDKALNDLRKSMMAPYQEAVLEESVGEVESAKTRWKKIREQSVPEEEYFQKATIKLKKYGAL